MSKLEQLREWVNKVNNGEYEESVFTAVEEAIIKYGPENIFLVSSDYHGLYQDDNCIFQYYNNVTGDIFWTSGQLHMQHQHTGVLRIV